MSQAALALAHHHIKHSYFFQVKPHSASRVQSNPLSRYSKLRVHQTSTSKKQWFSLRQCASSSSSSKQSYSQCRHARHFRNMKFHLMSIPQSSGHVSCNHCNSCPISKPAPPPLFPKPPRRGGPHPPTHHCLAKHSMPLPTMLIQNTAT